MKKFLIYCNSDGINEALRFTIKSLISLVYARSRTLFYESTIIPEFTTNKDILIQEYTEFELKIMNFDRLHLLDISKLLTRGSRCCVGKYNNGSSLTFSWLHVGNYNVHNAGIFALGEKEYWIGPTFVHKELRGKGYNKLQICWQMQQNGPEAKYYTSVNENNIASWKSFEHLGYMRIGETLVVKILGHIVKKVVIGEKLREKLK